MTPGQIVFSKQGRDKGRPFIIIKTEGEFAFLADGDLRKLANPKKKKFMHIQPTNAIAAGLIEKLNGPGLLDADVRKALKSAGFKLEGGKNG